MTISPQNLRALVEIEREKRRRSQPKTADALTWATTNATIPHPQRGLVSFVPYPYQAQFLGMQAPRRIILKARQIGFSQVFALEALYTAAHTPGATILLVSRSQDLAVNLLRYCYVAYNRLRNAPTLVKENESEMGLANGSRIKSIPANRSTGRGFAATDVYLDEFAYASYADEIYQSVSPTISQGGRLTIGSTPNGVGNLFHSLWGGGEFTRMRVPWYRCPAYNPEGATLPDDDQARAVGEAGAWYAKEHQNYTAAQWAAEYDCDFVGSGDAVFGVDLIDRAEVGALGDMPPVAGHHYVTSVDVGRRNDATVINTVDTSVDPYQRVVHERLERTPYPILQQRVKARMDRYPGRLLIESNGIGDPFIETMDVPADSFVTTAKSKVQAIQSFQLLLEQGRYKAIWTPQERRELIGYQWQDANLVQDCVMSLAIGAQALDRPEPRLRWL